jgi:hypothetical protein
MAGRLAARTQRVYGCLVPFQLEPAKGTLATPREKGPIVPIAHTYIEPPGPLAGDELQAERRPGLALRLRVRWNALALDSALADGADPGSTDQLALRAKQLARQKQRAQVAQGIGHVVALVDRGSAVGLATTRVPFRRDRVEASRQELLELTGRLSSKDPYPVKGLAMANLLLEDGDSPLYVHDRPDRLERTVKATLAALHR